VGGADDTNLASFKKIIGKMRGVGAKKLVPLHRKLSMYILNR
jgi:hypothetical protein